MEEVLMVIGCIALGVKQKRWALVIRNLAVEALVLSSAAEVGSQWIEQMDWAERTDSKVARKLVAYMHSQAVPFEDRTRGWVEV
jgi:hypothetical protein